MSELEMGEEIPVYGGGVAKIIEKIGEGGQGTVYKAEYNNKNYALKWYAPSKINDKKLFKDNIYENINEGKPSDCFLWPLYLTDDYKNSFGYLMDLRPDNFVSFSDILNRKNEFKDINSLVQSALNIVEGFRDLHRKGYSYQDLNDGNFFINVDNGDILICDNDNVAPDGKSTNIAGKPGYMAPEIVRGESKPNSLTDYHSLAVVLFKLLIRHDPLMGKMFVSKVCITEEAEKDLYGDNPLFIFDPNDNRNCPVPGIHPNPIKLWPLYPKDLKDTFIQAFSKGMKNPNIRPTDNEWKRVLVSLRGQMIACNKCGFIELASALTKNSIIECKKCKNKFPYPLFLKINNHKIILSYHNKLYRCHTEINCDDSNTVTGIVVVNKKNPKLFGIKNLSNKQWTLKHNNTTKVINHDEVMPVIEGSTIYFDQVKGVVESII